MGGKTLAAVGIIFLAVVALGAIAAYGTPLAIANSCERRGQGHGQPWWTQGLTEQQIAEMREKI